MQRDKYDVVIVFPLFVAVYRECVVNDFDKLIPGKTCVSWNEPSDPDTWYDNYLCY